MKDAVADAAGTKGTHDFTLEVICVTSDVGDLPVAALDHLVCGHEVAHEQEDAHDDVLCDGDDVGASDLEHLNALLDTGIEVDVVGADTSGDTELEVLRLSMKSKLVYQKLI